MLGLALTGLEAALNRLLGLDPDTLTRLAEIDGKVIEVQLTDWNLRFVAIPNPSGIALHANYSGPTDTLIAGRLAALFQVSRAGGETSELFKNKITTRGDIETGEKLRDILSRIDIDWEEKLATVMGDTLANKLGKLAHRFKDAGNATCHTLQINLREFLQLEANALPTAAQVSDFISQVAELRNAVERAEARINQLKLPRKANS